MWLVRYLLYLSCVSDGSLNDFYSRGAASNFWPTSKANESILNRCYARAKRSQNFNNNIPQHCWRVWPPCCDMLGLLAQIWKLNRQIFSRNICGCLQQCCVRACVLVRFSGSTRRNRVAKRTKRVAPNNVAIRCVVLRSFGQGFKS